jgi:Phage portal protein, SPP1 Gp6-like
MDPKMMDEIKFNVQDWDKKIKQAESLRNNNERQWFYNMAFHKGNQWAVWVKNPVAGAGFSLTQPKSSRKRLVINKIRPVIRNEFTKLTKEEGQFFVNPSTSDLSDVSAAKTAEAVSEYLAYMGKFNKARRSAVWWASVCGNGYIKTWYDTAFKIPNRIDSEGASKEQPIGSVSYMGVSPFHVFVPYLDMEDMDEQPWVVHARTFDPKVVKATYKKSLEADTESSNLGFEQRFLSSINVSNSNRFKQVHVKEVWVKPCQDYPEGMLAIYASGEVLYKGKFPYDHGEYPFQKINSGRTGGYYSSSVIEDLIPMQKEYNLTRSQLAEARDLTSKPALTVTKGTVDVKKVKAVPGQIIEVQPGGDPPRRLINPDMPAYVMQGLEIESRDMDESSGQFEVTRGRTPPGIEAASAIAYLQEENDTRLHDTISSIEDAVSDSGRQSLMLVQQYWNQTRIVNTVSNAHLQGTIEFLGKDLKNNTDFRVVAGSMAPRSLAAKQAFILEAIKMQLIPPEVGLKNLPLADQNSMYDEIHVDTNQAERENLRMARGEPVVANDWDDHIVHVKVVENYMKSQAFELLKPEVQELFINHRQEHKTIAIAESMELNASGPDEQPAITDGEPGLPTGEQQFV